MKSIRAHVIISGIVQGVGFRYNTKNMARSLKLNGWVRNLESGEVEAVFEGKEDKVKEMVEWCRSGSKIAKVSDISVVFEDYAEGLEDFRIL